MHRAELHPCTSTVYTGLREKMRDAPISFYLAACAARRNRQWAQRARCRPPLRPARPNSLPPRLSSSPQPATITLGDLRPRASRRTRFLRSTIFNEGEWWVDARGCMYCIFMWYGMWTQDGRRRGRNRGPCHVHQVNRRSDRVWARRGRKHATACPVGATYWIFPLVALLRNRSRQRVALLVPLPEEWRRCDIVSVSTRALCSRLSGLSSNFNRVRTMCAGAFLIPYFIMAIVEGLPLFYLELLVGQSVRRGAFGVWRILNPRLSGIGIASAVVCTSHVHYLYCISLTLGRWMFTL